MKSITILFSVLAQQPAQFIKASVKTEPADPYNQSYGYSLHQQPTPADIKPVLPPGYSVVQMPNGGVPVQMNQLGLPPGQAQALQQVKLICVSFIRNIFIQF